MKKSCVLLLAACLALGNAGSVSAEEDKSVVLSFDSNPTTGYVWTGFVIAGNSVELEDVEGSYEADENPEMLDGVGGTTYFQINPVEPGQSLVRFDYARSWEEGHDKRMVFLADVDEDLNLTATDVTFSCMEVGTVIDVDEENHSVTITSDWEEEIIAAFADELALPVMDEEVVLYTNGIMTMSIPPMVNVMAWETVPSEYGREYEEEFDLSLEDIVAEMRLDMQELATDKVYLGLFTQSESILEKAAAYAEICKTEPVKLYEIVIHVEDMLQVEDIDYDALSDTGFRMLRQRLESASVYASMAAAKNGPEDVAAVSILNICKNFDGNAEGGIYAAEFENGAAMLLSINCENEGKTTVTAHMIPELAALSENPGMEIIEY